jgi:methionyl aminopeptidase
MVILKTTKEIDNIRKSCNTVALVLKTLYRKAEVGIKTIELNNIAEKICKNKKATPGFKGYKGFPYSICSSVNNEIVHGFPSNRKLKEGDILSIDFGVIYNKWYGDAAFTKVIGKGSYMSNKINNITNKCLYSGIEKALPGNRLGDVGYAIQSKAYENKFNVILNFVGHGIGKKLHEEPQVLNYGNKNEGLLLKPGMVIAIEPMLVEKSNKVETLSNDWTVVTKDGGISAHWEHTIAILESGPEILTKWN